MFANIAALFNGLDDEELIILVVSGLNIDVVSVFSHIRGGWVVALVHADWTHDGVGDEGLGGTSNLNWWEDEVPWGVDSSRWPVCWVVS